MTPPDTSEGRLPPVFHRVRALCMRHAPGLRINVEYHASTVETTIISRQNNQSQRRREICNAGTRGRLSAISESANGPFSCPLQAVRVHPKTISPLPRSDALKSAACGEINEEPASGGNRARPVPARVPERIGKGDPQVARKPVTVVNAPVKSGQNGPGNPSEKYSC